MNRVARKLDQAYENALCLPIDQSSRIVLMSDCHRGIGNWGDNFQSNQNVFFAALQYYNRRRYTYIELGDGDELWENRSMKEIIRTHSNQFWLLSKFYCEGRFYMLYGNHDRKKAGKNFCQSTCSSYYCEADEKCMELFPDLKAQEAIRLTERGGAGELFLVHGHQGDLLNDTLWLLTRFLVRYVWRPLELAGCNDPTSAAKNYQKKERTEKRLSDWAAQRKTVLIAGHTHRPAFPKPGEGFYFNDGSCVHPRCITALEIACGEISLVKWSEKVRPDNVVYIGRDVLEEPVSLAEYYEKQG